MVGLRLREGIDLEAFARAYGVHLASAYPEPIAELIDSGHLLSRDGHLRLTDRGRLVIDAVLARLVAGAHRGLSLAICALPARWSTTPWSQGGVVGGAVSRVLGWRRRTVVG